MGILHIEVGAPRELPQIVVLLLASLYFIKRLQVALSVPLPLLLQEDVVFNIDATMHGHLAQINYTLIILKFANCY